MYRGYRRTSADLVGCSGGVDGAVVYRFPEPRHVNLTGDSAYVVVPASMTFNIQGKQVTQTGSTFTVALRKLGTEWRLTGLGLGKRHLTRGAVIDPPIGVESSCSQATANAPSTSAAVPSPSVTVGPL